MAAPLGLPEEIGLAILEPPGHSKLIADEQGIILKKKLQEELFGDLSHDGRPGRPGESSEDE